jgi:multiple sugar transport system substrate-binding protein
MRFSALFNQSNMQKNASPENNQTESLPSRSSADSVAENPEQPVESINRLNRRDFLKTSGLALAGMSAASTLIGPRRAVAASPVELTFASAKFYGKETIAEVVNAFNSSQGNIRVTYKELPPPSSSTEVHQTLVQQLARRNGDPDVFTQDIIWIAEFAAARWALPLDEYFKDSTKDYFPGIVQACTWDGKLTALPWFVDSGMLYYRNDLGMSAPKTWQDLVTSAQQLTSSEKVKFGFLWQAKQAEVLVCDLVSFIGSNGGSILQPDGRTVSIGDDAAVEAVQLMYDLINKYKVTPSDVLSWDEEPSRRPFTGGEAAYLRNWSYVWKIAQTPGESKVVDKVEVVPLPHFPGKNSAAALGGYQYGVNASTKKREAAVEFVKWLSSPEIQLRFATQLGLCPTRSAVFESQDIAKEQPFMQKLKDVFLGAIPRPVTPKYPQVTLALQSAVSRALTNGNVKAELQDAKQKIEAIVKA